jgi:hypothetical protein
MKKSSWYNIQNLPNSIFLSKMIKKNRKNRIQESKNEKETLNKKLTFILLKGSLIKYTTRH